MDLSPEILAFAMVLSVKGIGRDSRRESLAIAEIGETQIQSLYLDDIPSGQHGKGNRETIEIPHGAVAQDGFRKRGIEIPGSIKRPEIPIARRLGRGRHEAARPPAQAEAIGMMVFHQPVEPFSGQNDGLERPQGLG